MSRRRIYPEFHNIEKYVWEALNLPGRTISQIETDRKGQLSVDLDHQKDRDSQIWHNKSNVDRFVADQLNLKLDDYNRGTDIGKNPLYNAIASEIGKLRRKNILIDLHRVRENSGMGVWRLNKTKLNDFAFDYTKKEIKNKNFHSDGLLTTVYVRQKQQAFRRELLHEYRECVFCGFKPEKYVVGAHIVPYSEMRITNPDNSMNPSNGLLLCKLCDVAFEHGSIIVEEDLGIMISEHLQDERVPAVKSWINLISSEIHIKDDAKYPPNPKYLKEKIALVQNSKNIQ